MRGRELAAIEALTEASSAAMEAGDLDTVNACFLEYVLIMFHVYLRESVAPHHHFVKDELCAPESSPWGTLKAHPSDEGFISFMGFDVETFVYIATHMEEALPERSAVRKGRRFMLDATDVTALTLHYFATRCSHKTLQMIFGVSHSILSRDLRLGMETLAQVLQNMEDAEVRWPSHEEMYAFALAIRGDDAPTDIFWPFAFVDGLALPIEQPSGVIEQNNYYSGYHHCTVVNNIFAFGPDGCIMWYSVNNPGHHADGGCVEGLYNRLRDLQYTPAAFGVIADAAFYNHFMGPKVMTPVKEGTHFSRIEVVRELQKRCHRWITFKRQAAEWGMRTLQSAFPRLKNNLCNNADVRLLLLKIVIGLHNLRTRRVGLNQIKTVYFDELLQHMILQDAGMDRGFVDDDL
jgi:hypothetical protein